MKRSEQVKLMISIISSYLKEHGIENMAGWHRIDIYGDDGIYDPYVAIYWECDGCLESNNRSCSRCRRPAQNIGSTRPINSIIMDRDYADAYRIRIRDWANPKIDPEPTLRRILKIIKSKNRTK